MATIGKTLFTHFRQVLHASAQYDQAITVFHRLKNRLEVSNLCSLSWDQTVTFSDLAHGLYVLLVTGIKKTYTWGTAIPAFGFEGHTVKSLFSAVLNLAQSSFNRRSSKRGWN